MPEQTIVEPTVQNQNQQTNNSEFDPNTLSAEARAYMSREIDRARTQASQTAANNTRKKVEQESKDSFETQLSEMRDQLRSSQLRACRSEVTSVLKGASVSDEDMPTYLDMFVGDDIDESVKKAQAFVSLLNTRLQTERDKSQAEALQNMTTPQVQGDKTASEAANLQAKMDEARKISNPQKRNIEMCRISRIAQEQKIELI